MQPAQDDYPDVLARAIAALLERGVDAGSAELMPIAYPPRAIARRAGPSRSLAARIYTRDRFRCRYCGRRTIPTVIMQLLGGIYPEIFPFHRNWKGGQTHPAIITRSPVIDHVVPGSQGGGWRDLDNMVTACWPCNTTKADLSLDQLGWRLRAILRDSWDGLVSYYPSLWAAAGHPDPQLHSDWLEAFGDARSEA